MLELAILGLLKERSMHGYQLSKRLTDTLGGFWRVSYGSLYPTLRRLERDRAVERVFDAQEVGRRKNVYRITEKGEELFQRLLEEAGAGSSCWSAGAPTSRNGSRPSPHRSRPPVSDSTRTRSR